MNADSDQRLSAFICGLNSSWPSSFGTVDPSFRQLPALKSLIPTISGDFAMVLYLHAVGHLYVSKSREVYAVGCLLTYQTLAQPANYQQTKRSVRLEFFGY